jgi:hypothetical protein
MKINPFLILSLLLCIGLAHAAEKDDEAVMKRNQSRALRPESLAQGGEGGGP